MLHYAHIACLARCKLLKTQQACAVTRYVYKEDRPGCTTYTCLSYGTGYYYAGFQLNHMTMNISVVSFPAGQRDRVTTICEECLWPPAAVQFSVPASRTNLASPTFQCGLN